MGTSVPVYNRSRETV